MIELKTRLILKSVLRQLIEKGYVSPRDISLELSFPIEFILDILSSYPLKIRGDRIEGDVTEFVVSAWQNGFNIVELALQLGWRELEKLCARIMNDAGYISFTNLRLKYRGRRYEIDIVAIKGGTILSIDCKRWIRARTPALKEAAHKQVERTEALAEKLHTLSYVMSKINADRVELYPLVISVHEPGINIYEGVPIVSLPRLRSFLSEFDSNKFLLLHFQVKIDRLT